MNDSGLPPLPCLCASFRRASRAITQCYDKAVRPFGLRATQFTVLQALTLTGEISQGKLGEILVLDSTTLTRTLDHMRRAGWISRRRGEDRREWRLRLSASGLNQLNRALPAWKEVQLHMAGRLGDKLWRDAFNLTGKVADLAVNSGDLS